MRRAGESGRTCGDDLDPSPESIPCPLASKFRLDRVRPWGKHTGHGHRIHPRDIFEFTFRTKIFHEVMDKETA